MKRYLSFFLILSLLFSMSTPIFGIDEINDIESSVIEEAEVKTEENVVVNENSDVKENTDNNIAINEESPEIITDDDIMDSELSADALGKDLEEVENNQAQLYATPVEGDYDERPEIPEGEEVTTTAFAQLYSDGTLIFKRNNDVFDSSIYGTLEQSFSGWEDKTPSSTNLYDRPWQNYRTSIKKVIFMDNIRPVSVEFWFEYLINLTSVEGLENLDTSRVTTFHDMFRRCEKLITLSGINTLNTSRVTDMSYMFEGCKSLISLDISNWDASKVTNLSYMFNSCSLVTTNPTNNTKIVEGIETLNLFANVNVAKSFRRMFGECNNLKVLTGLDSWYTDNVTDMYYLFNDCWNLKTLDLTNWMTDNVTNMDCMFKYCRELTSIGDVSGWDTSSVTTMKEMFRDCQKLTKLDGIGNWNVSSVTNMNEMFHYCKALTSLDLSNWVNSNLTNFEEMFSWCNNITELDISGLDMSNATNARSMFEYCYNLKSIILPRTKINNPIDMYKMFNYCGSLEFLDLSMLQATPTNLSSAFYECRNLKELDLGGWNGSSCVNSTRVFRLCPLERLTLGSGFTFSSGTPELNGTTLTYDLDGNVVSNVFSGTAGTYLKNKPEQLRAYVYDGNTLVFKFPSTAYSGTLTEDLGEVRKNGYYNGESLGGMYITTAPWGKYFTKIDKIYFLDIFSPNSLQSFFAGMSEVKNIYGLKNVNTGNVTNLAYMFRGCSHLISLDLSDFDTQRVTNMYAMFDSCSNLVSLNLMCWDTNNVTNMSFMFNGCGKLVSLDLGSFNTGNVVDMSYMFTSCQKLESIELGNFITNNVTTMRGMFNSCSSLHFLDLSTFDTHSVTNMDGMFTYMPHLQSITLGPNFSFNGSGATRLTNLPVPSSSYIPGADGYWYTLNKSNEEHRYLPENIPNNTSTTYYAVAKGPYAYIYSDGTMVFQNGTVKDTSHGAVIAGPFNAEGRRAYEDSDECPWNDYRDKVKKIIFMDEITPIYSTTYWFLGFNNLEFADLTNLNTGNIYRIDGMFNGCNKLKEIKVGKNFSFIAYDEDGNENEHLILPAQSSDNIPGADGKWYTYDGTAYDPDKIPSNVEQTYYAYPHTVSYTINHYKQNLDGKTYADPEVDNTNTATINSDVTVTSNTYTGFHINTEKSQLTKNVGADNTTVFDIYYDRDSYSVSYTNGGQNVVNTSVLYGETVSVPVVTKSGYTFAGWYQGNVQIDPAAAVTSNINATAKWIANTDTQYTVRHLQQNIVGNEYTVIETENLTGTTDATVTVTPKEYTGFHLVNGQTLTANINGAGTTAIDIKYDRNLINVHINDVVTSVRYGAIISVPEHQDNAGYTFSHWSTSVGGNTYDFNTPITTEITLYPVYIANTDTAYTIEHYQQNINDNNYTLFETENLTGTTDTTATASDKGYIGFHIVEGQNLTANINGDGKAVIKVYYDRNIYSVTYTDEGNMVLSDNIRYEGHIGTLANPSKMGYTFIGWYEGENKVDPTQKVTGTINAISKYAANTYTISFNADVGALNEGEVTNKTVTYDGEYGKLPGASKVGYDFTGWYLGEIKINETDIVKVIADTELVAKYTPRSDTVYTINYYIQNTSLDGYNLYSDLSTTATSTTDTTVSETPKNITGFHVNKEATGYKDSGNLNGDGSLVLSLYYDRNAYTVTFNANNGSLGEQVNTKNVVYGLVYGTLPTPTRAGYTFEGWINASGNVVTESSVFILTGNETLTAKWTANTNTPYIVEHYQQNINDDNYVKVDTDNLTGTTDTTATAIVKTYTGFHEALDNINRVPSSNVNGDGSLVLKLYYDRDIKTVIYTNDGNKEVDTIVRYGGTVTIPTVTKIGYTFAGWYENGSKINETAPVVSDINAVAVWTANTYIVTINPVEGALPEGTQNSITVTYDAIYGELPVPVRAGYDFVSWTLNGEKVNKDSVVKITTDSELTPEWSARADTKYVVKHYKQDVTGDGYSEVITEEFADTTDTLATATVNTYIGFHENTSHADKLYSSNINGDGSCELRVYYDRDIKTVVYTDNGNEVVNTSVRYGNTVTVPVVSKDGYTFIGWYEGNNEVDITAVITADINAVSKYAANTYTITFDPGIGTLNNGDSISKNVVYDNTYGDMPTPFKIGYTFVGWFNGENKVEATDTVKILKDTTFTAHFVANTDTKYVVNYYKQNVDLNGFTVDLTLMQTKQGTTDETAFLAENDYIQIDGFTLDENNINSVRTSVINGDGTTELKIFYTRNKYKVSFSLTDGVLPEESATEKEVVFGAPVGELPVPTKNGYRFVSWINEKGENINSETIVSVLNDTILTATWKVNDDEKPIVKITGSDGQPLNNSHIEIKQGNKVFKESLTDINGNISLKDIPEGYYNVVITKDNLVETSIIYVSENQDGINDVQIGEGGVDSVLRVNEGTKDVVVGNLDKLKENENLLKPEDKAFVENGGAAVFVMNITAVPEEVIQERSSDLISSAHNDNKTISGYLQMDISKTLVNTDGSMNTLAIPDVGNDYLLEIHVPLTDWQKNRTGYVVYRMHEGQVYEITEEKNENGAYLKIINGNELVVYASKFSDYCLAFDRPVHKIKFDIGDGKLPDGTSDNLDVTYEKPFGELPIPIKDGYTFIGWYDESGNKVEPNDIFMEDSDIKLSAKWEANTDTTYKVEFYLQKTTLDGYEINSELTKNYQGTTDTTTSISEEVLNITGFSLNKDAEGSLISSTINGNGSTVLKFYFDRNKYTLTLNLDGGSLNEEIATSMEIAYGTAIGELPTPTRPSHNFKGWIIGETTVSSEMIWEFTENKEAVAQWVRRSSGRPRPNQKEEDLDDMEVPKDDGLEYPSDRFTDVDKSDWYHEAVNWGISNGYFTGTSKNTWSPNGSLSRAQAATVIARMDGYKETAIIRTLYNDVAINHWAVSYINYCTDNSFMLGYGNDKFGPEDALTREQFALVLYRIYADKEKSYTWGGMEGEASKVSSWAADAMCWAVSEGIIKGNESGDLMAQKAITRAEACTVLMRLENMKAE